VLRARTEGPFCIFEALSIGEQRLLGEVIQLRDDELVAQVYEDTTGLEPGMPVEGRGRPLAVSLGPGLLGGIFDGLLRPLTGAAGFQVQPGFGASRELRCQLAFTVRMGDVVEPGASFATVVAPREQQLLVPPWAKGTVASVASDGEHGSDEVLLVLVDASGTRHTLRMHHDWPVRRPRPVRERMGARAPMITGQRILDSAVPGGARRARGDPRRLRHRQDGAAGSARQVAATPTSSSTSAVASVATKWPACSTSSRGSTTRAPAVRSMERTVIIANTSNMPVAAREASIYSAITVAEYFRDQGLHVALMADSTSRWAEALREVSGRFGELPGEGGYPAYLSSRLAEFYERAARVGRSAGRRAR
jgi:V/A-type H+-transporting ATPase subunit A